jgi:2-polyprenyl-3-methyl-5-hydroxy-6-metoxy-1,4-benzoquinol methylase
MVTRIEVVNAFRTLLGREPENPKVIDDHLVFETLPELCAALARSGEFQDNFRRQHSLTRTIHIDQLDEVAASFLAGDHERWRGHSLELPNWFDQSLAPASKAYRKQMVRFWEVITNRSDYRPERDEDTPEIADLDAIYRPAFFAGGDTQFAGGQIMATGHILMRSGIQPGQRVLEYGAGFGQTALAFARLGAKVDTVDINAAFCGAIRQTAERYQVDLTPHHAEYGFNPAGKPHAYDLIFFYESFHHCLDFETLIPKLREYLTPTGRVILAGEPIFDGLCPDMPYPWGFRLDWENVAIMRIRGWLELGFERSFLLDRFAQAGFACTLHSDPNSHWAQVYEFRQIG